MREAVAGGGNLDLDADDQAPDLVVEVHITSPCLNKLSVYARLSVPEVWRHDGGRMVVFRPADEAVGEEPRYTEAPESVFLPGATGDVLTRFVAEGLTLDRRVWRRRVRHWAQGVG